MALQVSASDGVKVYNISANKKQPQWAGGKRRPSLVKDQNFGRSIDLIQDLHFPAACQRLKISPDGQFLFASGIHPPRVRVFELSQLSLKFERHLDSQIVEFQVLTEDYSKLAFLCEDRTLHFHAKFGAYHKTRIPRAGRDIAYASAQAELLVAASSPDIYRLSLADGLFMAPLQSRSPAVNACGVAPAHGLVGCAGEDGWLECFDLRQRRSVGAVNAAAAMDAPGEELRALRFSDSGLHCAVGTSNGLVAVFDLRSSRPTVIKDHMYDAPIVDIKFHTPPGGSTQRIVSADTHIVKVWDASSGSTFTNIEPTEGSINDVCLWKDSGLAMLACDSPRIPAYFVPAMGSAPRWASFLEGLTEELEEDAAPAIYDDYKFVTTTDLDKLGLGHLIGTPLLRAHLHGYFLDNRLYKKARDLVQPFAYDAYRQQRIQQKLDAERQSRIGIVRKAPKVNAKAAARMLAGQKNAGPDGEKAGAAEPGLVDDPRFKAMFEQDDFAIDEDTKEYRALHPNRDAKGRDQRLVEEHFETVGSSDDEDGADANGAGPSASGSDYGMDSDAADSDGLIGEDSDEDYQRRRARKQAAQRPSKAMRPQPTAKRREVGGPRMLAAKDAAAAAAFRRRESLSEAHALPLSERIPHRNPDVPGKSMAGGRREMSFTPSRRGRGRSGPGDEDFGDGISGGRRGSNLTEEEAEAEDPAAAVLVAGVAAEEEAGA
ncbi:hypothetical protein WJX84_003781 [Apatococcus fuscideae]|uniref:NUC153 domain-containing protein n=1 Tax=Apatococcus fuscideae TaxID=2026836 RepID=A0AAW1TCS7_9CHLO